MDYPRNGRGPEPLEIRSREWPRAMKMTHSYDGFYPIPGRLDHSRHLFRFTLATPQEATRGREGLIVLKIPDPSGVETSGRHGEIGKGLPEPPTGWSSPSSASTVSNSGGFHRASSWLLDRGQSTDRNRQRADDFHSHRHTRHVPRRTGRRVTPSLITRPPSAPRLTSRGGIPAIAWTRPPLPRGDTGGSGSPDRRGRRNADPPNPPLARGGRFGRTPVRGEQNSAEGLRVPGSVTGPRVRTRRTRPGGTSRGFRAARSACGRRRATA